MTSTVEGSTDLETRIIGGKLVLIRPAKDIYSAVNCIVHSDCHRLRFGEFSNINLELKCHFNR